MKELTAEKLKLGVMLNDTQEQIEALEQKLQQSFTNGGDSDLIANQLAQLKTKRDGLTNAITTNQQAIAEAEQQAIDDAEAKDLKTRQGHVKDALKALDNAVKLQGQLLEQLDLVVSNNSAALFRNHSEIENSIRGIVGRMAARYKLHGALQQATTIPIPSTKDYERLAGHVKGA